MSDLEYLTSLATFAHKIIEYDARQTDQRDASDDKLVDVVRHHLKTIERSIDRLAGVPPREQRTEKPYEAIVRLARASEHGVNAGRELKKIFGITE